MYGLLLFACHFNTTDIIRYLSYWNLVFSACFSDGLNRYLFTRPNAFLDNLVYIQNNIIYLYAYFTDNLVNTKEYNFCLLHINDRYSTFQRGL